MRSKEPAARPGYLLLGVGARCSKFRILGLIAEGGMGRVYDAVDEYLDRRVALKVVKPERMSDADFIRGHRKEARTLADLNHPNIVRLYDAGVTEDGVVYIAMERVEGISLRLLMQRVRLLDVRSALSIAIQIADAIRVAHEGGIIHRDLKPENVLIARSSLVKVVDFGLARRIEGSSSSDVFPDHGTVHYMAPEQMHRRGAVGKPVDVYAIGLILYELLAGRYPFADASGNLPPKNEVAMNHLLAAPRPLVESVEGFLEGGLTGLSDFVLRMLAKEPADRPSSGEVYDALTAEFERYSNQHPEAEGRFVPETKSRTSKPDPEEAAPVDAALTDAPLQETPPTLATAPLDAGFQAPESVMPFRASAPELPVGLGRGYTARMTGTPPSAAAPRTGGRWPTTERMLPSPVAAGAGAGAAAAAGVTATAPLGDWSVGPSAPARQVLLPSTITARPDQHASAARGALPSVTVPSEERASTTPPAARMDTASKEPPPSAARATPSASVTHATPSASSVRHAPSATADPSPRPRWLAFAAPALFGATLVLAVVGWWMLGRSRVPTEPSPEVRDLGDLLTPTGGPPPPSPSVEPSVDGAVAPRTSAVATAAAQPAAVMERAASAAAPPPTAAPSATAPAPAIESRPQSSPVAPPARVNAASTKRPRPSVPGGWLEEEEELLNKKTPPRAEPSTAPKRTAPPRPF